MGSILFIIVVAIAVIAVFIYHQSRAVKAEKNNIVLEVKREKPVVAAKPATAAITEPKEAPKKAKPSAAPQQAAKEAQPEVALNLPDALAEITQALAKEQEPLARHRLLTQITDTTYRQRKDAQYRAACDYFSTLHINEFGQIKQPLKESNSGKLPQVMTFQNYANLLLEDERFDEAIKVCRQALAFGLDDKTQTGFAGRIERIQVRQKKAAG